MPGVGLGVKIYNISDFFFFHFFSFTFISCMELFIFEQQYCYYNYYYLGVNSLSILTWDGLRYFIVALPEPSI